MYFFEDIDKLQQHAQRRWGLNEEAAKRFANISLKDGYANLSQKAMRNILPFLKEGHLYSHAVALGGVRNVFGSRWAALSSEKKELICTNIPEMVGHDQEDDNYRERISKFLKNEFALSDNNLRKLYHHSIKEVELQKRWTTNEEADKEIQELRNPVVICALFELRKLFNSLINRYGGRPSCVKIELARDLKQNRKQRKQYQDNQKRLEKERQKAMDMLKEYGQPLSEDFILKYRLWEESSRECVYSGKSISLGVLFSHQIQIDHILPFSRSLDDSFMNKVVCFTEENRQKDNRTPYEWNGDSKEVWEEFKTRALKMFHTSKEYPNRYKKFEMLMTKKLREGFKNKQLTDTAYAAKKAKEYLKKVCEQVDTVPGRATAQLRGAWGLNAVLYNLDEDKERLHRYEDEDEKEFLRRRGEAYGKKNREDHRHHALDAIVLAFTNQGHVQKLSELHRSTKTTSEDDKQKQEKEWRKQREIIKAKRPPPTEDFWIQCREAIEQILISYKKPRGKKIPVSKRKATSLGRGCRCLLR